MSTNPLSSREQEVLRQLAYGNTLRQVAGILRIKEGAAQFRLRTAKAKLHGVRTTSTAIAVGYATRSLPRPPILGRLIRNFPDELRVLVPVIAQGKSAKQIASHFSMSIVEVRADCHRLLTSLQAKNRPHMITRAWQYQILTEQQIKDLIRRSALCTTPRMP